jgi:hypothetical protein
VYKQQKIDFEHKALIKIKIRRVKKSYLPRIIIKMGFAKADRWTVQALCQTQRK